MKQSSGDVSGRAGRRAGRCRGAGAGERQEGWRRQGTQAGCQQSQEREWRGWAGSKLPAAAAAAASCCCRGGRGLAAAALCPHTPAKNGTWLPLQRACKPHPAPAHSAVSSWLTMRHLPGLPLLLTAKAPPTQAVRAHLGDLGDAGDGGGAPGDGAVHIAQVAAPQGVGKGALALNAACARGEKGRAAGERGRVCCQAAGGARGRSPTAADWGPHGRQPAAIRHCGGRPPRLMRRRRPRRNRGEGRQRGVRQPAGPARACSRGGALPKPHTETVCTH